ncbi:uncharacterized protein RJT20DRAFT_133842 [Scheffersomyces xylosifermentans]|uniref:uncharacterized protein n=1 Tax=Scheffersomyces xylosifermentans TaxID=1304137 RepID=UPI00315D6614
MSKVSVAIIGLNGFVGKPILEAIESGKYDDKLKFPIKAVTRKETPSTNKIQYVVGSLEDDRVEELSEKLAGTDVIIELITPDPNLFAVIEKIVLNVKPKLFLPSQFGSDIDQVQEYAPGFLAVKKDHSERLRAKGIKVVDFVTGLFAVPGTWLYEWVGAAGADVESKTVVFRGDPQTKISITKLFDIGNSVVSLITLDPSTIPDTVRIESDEVTFQDIIDRYEQTHNVKFDVVKHISKEDALVEFRESVSKGFDRNQIFYYLNAIASQGLDKGLNYSENHNELVNPRESLWKWGKF